jgi:hypothetical protein
VGTRGGSFCVKKGKRERTEGHDMEKTVKNSTGDAASQGSANDPTPRIFLTKLASQQREVGYRYYFLNKYLVCL